MVGLALALPAIPFVIIAHAPRQAFVAIPDAGHFAVVLKPNAFLHEPETRVRSLR
jgi:hypothetical protein